MLYTKNLITRGKTVSEYNNAVRQINALDHVNRNYLQALYDRRKTTYVQLTVARNNLDTAVASLKKATNCAREISKVL